MEKAAIFHRPESEYAYLYTNDKMHVRLKTKRDDVACVTLRYGDPYLTNRVKDQQRIQMKKIATTTHSDYWQATIGARFNRIHYCFEIVGLDKEHLLYGERGFVPFEKHLLKNKEHYFRMPYFHAVDRYKAPDWVAGTVWYQIFPERFANGDPARSPEHIKRWSVKTKPNYRDFFGGDLQGIIDKLDYLQSLGVNGLYLCPIFEAPSNHKYDTTDYFEVDRHFGDKQLFKQLVTKAHERGIKIMLDAVFNHAGASSLFWQDVIEKGACSEYFDWFHIHEVSINHSMRKGVFQRGANSNYPYEMFAFAQKMPKFNTTNPAVQQYLLRVATYWIEEFDIDGWRLDVANEVDHHFWQLFHKTVLALKPDLYIVGEVWHSAQSWLNGNEFHAVMNYALTNHMRDFFLFKQYQPSHLLEQTQAQLMLYRQSTNEAMFNVIDSHDTARMLTMANGDQDVVKAVLVYLFMQKGSPCMYYGTEVGMKGGADPDCRRVMPWDPVEQNAEMLHFVRQLVRFRRQYYQIINYGIVEYNVLSDSNRQFEMTVRSSKKRIKVIFNMGEQRLSVPLENARLLFGNRYEQQNKHLVLSVNGVAILIK